MNLHPVHATILEFLAGQNPSRHQPPPELDHNLLERHQLTSLGFLELIQLLEEQTGVLIDFTTTDPASLVTLRGLLTAFQVPHS
ncbi:MAG: hypothetical protein HQL96_05055 [Magnetococcales bacterium]|nr:hypothetical protein [Magnetococcales bacterium]